MSRVIKCPKCSRDLSVPEELVNAEVKCSVCGHVFSLAAPVAELVAEPVAAPTVPPTAAPSAAPGWRPPGQLGDEVYDLQFDLNRVDPAVRTAWSQWKPTPFSVAGAIVLDLISCGLFGLIYYGLKFGELPKISRRDFGVGEAIGFSFIPYFNYYWVFRFWLGLCDRLNLQFRLRNMPVLSRGLALAIPIVMLSGAVLWIVPFAGIGGIIAYMVCREIFVGQMQAAINQVAAASMASYRTM